MRITVRKWGNSAAIRIPASILRSTKIGIDEPVEVREEGHRIVIEPLHPRVYDLDQLLDGITRDNLHDPVDFGPEVGKEGW